MRPAVGQLTPVVYVGARMCVSHESGSCLRMQSGWSHLDGNLPRRVACTEQGDLEISSCGVTPGGRSREGAAEASGRLHC